MCIYIIFLHEHGAFQAEFESAPVLVWLREGSPQCLLKEFVMGRVDLFIIFNIFNTIF